MRGILSILLLVCSHSFAAPPGAVTGSGSSASLFCCNDANGKQACGDILPPSCYGRAYREVGANGRTLRTVEAPLTAEQRARRAADEQARKEEEARQKEQQRKDQALLNTYGSVADIEALRKRSLEEVKRAISDAENRIEKIKAMRTKFENEAEFYKKKKLPPDVEKGLADTAFEIKAQESIIEDKRKEIGTLDARYEEDRRRYLELQRRPAAR